VGAGAEGSERALAILPPGGAFAARAVPARVVSRRQRSVTGRARACRRSWNSGVPLPSPTAAARGGSGSGARRRRPYAGAACTPQHGRARPARRTATCACAAAGVTRNATVRAPPLHAADGRSSERAGCIVRPRARCWRVTGGQLQGARCSTRARAAAALRGCAQPQPPRGLRRRERRRLVLRWLAAPRSSSALLAFG
jgi:hypothetical protein